MFVTFITSAIAFGMIFLYGCIGEIIMEKSGHLNLGVPGIMCVGCAGGCYGVSIYINSLADRAEASWLLLVLIAVLFAFVFAAACGLIYAFLTVSMKSNQNVTGLAITTFGSGFAQFFIGRYVDDSCLSYASRIISRSLPVSENLGAFGEIFLSHGILVYLAIVIALVVGFVLRRTKVGLHLRSVGENPYAADAVGINVNSYKYTAILIGSGIAGLGGLFYVMDFVKGSWENSSTIEALGWLSIALVIFTLWKPYLSIFGSVVFGGLYIISFYINIQFTLMKLMKMLPYVVTIIVLIVTSIRNSKENQGPASLGLAYFREER